MLTDNWRRKAFERYEIDEHRCVGCGCYGTQTNPLECHHLTYYNIFNEDVEKDLVTLCRNCHGHLHQIMNRITNKETGQHGWKDKLIFANRIDSETMLDYLREEIEEDRRKFY